MKRVFDEISDEEWENHSFKPSRILGASSTSKFTTPPIESFAFNSRSDDHFVDLTNDREDEGFELQAEDLEDHDADDVTAGRSVGRGRRFVVDDDEDEAAEVVEVKSDEDEEEPMLFDVGEVR